MDRNDNIMTRRPRRGSNYSEGITYQKNVDIICAKWGYRKENGH